ncbi:MAG: hypothetical protein PVH04_01950 [Gammaproteobacteria bacterium]|jgi:hypothetical protein
MQLFKRVIGGLVLALLVSSNAHAEEGEFSLGVATITPNGVTAKYWTSDVTAIEVFGSWSFNSEEYKFHVNLLLHDFDKIQLEGERIAFYYGGGIRIKEEKNKDTRLGVRIPFGVSYFTQSVPVEFFGEATPRINIYPSTNFGLDLMVGLRYRFI